MTKLRNGNSKKQNKISTSFLPALFRISLLIFLIIAWIAYFQVSFISQKLGLLNDPNIIHTGIIAFFASLCLLSIFAGILYTPLQKWFQLRFRSRITKFPKTKSSFFLLPIFFFLCLVVLIVKQPFSASFGAFRFYPMLIWAVLASIAFALTLKFSTLFEKLASSLATVKFIWISLFIAAIALIAFLFVSPRIPFFQELPQRLVLFIVTSFFGFECSIFVFTKQRHLILWSLTALLQIAAILVAYQVTLISPYPFTLAWSEGKWFLDGSLIFARKVYGIHAPIPFWEPTQAILKSFPFIFTNTPSMLLQRFWEFLLIIGIPLLTAIIVAKKFARLKGFWMFFLFLFVFCFLFVGPVKFYLLAIFLIFIIAYDPRRFSRMLMAVFLASLFIPPSRLNWYPVPSALAIVFHVLHTPYKGSFFDYLKKPLSYICLNLATLVLVNFLFIQFSGNPISVYSIISTSPFLWYRLFSFPSKPLGILIPMIVHSVPYLFIIIVFLRKNSGTFHWLRQTIMFAILAVFFLGGSLVSAKIGGGNNLHNLDIYMLLLLTITSAIVSETFFADKAFVQIGSSKLAFLGLVIALLTSFWLLYSTPAPVLIPEQGPALTSLQKLKNQVDNIKKTDTRPALFIYQTQLLTSGLIKGVLPVPNVDNVYVMELAISGKQQELNSFYSRLENHEWSMIVMPPLYAKIKDVDTEFAEENNVWVQRIIFPMLCSYQSAYIDKDYDYEILIPRDKNHQCP